MAVVEIAGKAVHLRERFPAREYYSLLAAVRSLGRLGEQPFAEQVGGIVAAVEKWEFEGKPEDIEAWAELDVFEELLPLLEAIDDHLAAKIARSKAKSKN